MEKRREEDSLDWMVTLRSLTVELRSCKVEDENIFKAQKKRTKVNVVILQSLLICKYRSNIN